MKSELGIRLGLFLGVFCIVAVLETLMPRRVRKIPRKSRWFTNLVILGLNPLSVRLVFPILPVAFALLVSERQWGLLNNLDLPYCVKIIIGVIALDFSIYIQHILHHAVPVLWRLHMVHHSDLDFDVTTGLRFHPLEIVISMGVKLFTVAGIGPPALAVLLFQAALNATSMFNHSNTHIPMAVDRVLRLFVVTPDMHRVHHSVIIRETNSNFGFNFPWWDRLFGTYKNQPDMGHGGMTIGLSQFRDHNRLTLPRLIILPFVGDPGSVPINRH